MLLLVRAEQRAPERVPSVVDRYFGRRSTLLHLSGCPCRYHRRVVAAKFTTSKYLFYCTYIIAVLFRFCNIYLLVDWQIVA